MNNVYYADGFCNKRYKGGYTVFKNDTHIKTVRLPHEITSNEAELEAVGYAAELAEEGDEIVTDSMNTIYWIRKPKSKVRADLMPRAEDIGDIISEKKIDLYWMGRDENLAGIYNELVLGL